MRYFKFLFFLTLLVNLPIYAATLQSRGHALDLYDLPGFFRFNFDNIKMPKGIADMGLLGLNYFADVTPNIYAGVGGYGSVTGTQGGLFVLGIGGGIHYHITTHLLADAGLFVGGGGGRSSLVGGGLMVRPQVGMMYEWSCARLGLHYSYVTFPSGEVRSSQIGLDLDIPYDFYYTAPNYDLDSLIHCHTIHLEVDPFLHFQRNDIALLAQAYRQKPGTLNVLGARQDGTIGLVGAELNHYFTTHSFWWVKTSGAFRGIPNGYMDILGGLGYHFSLIPGGIALVPQLGIGAGGGGNVQTGGGILIQPQIGIELPLTPKFSLRASGGYLWSPKGNMQAYTLTTEILYHLDLATGSNKPAIESPDAFLQNWRIQIFNQTYLRPARNYKVKGSLADYLIALQFDQFFSPYFFMSYQAAFAYAGTYAGGLATGMIGPGLQTNECYRVKLFGELLVGAGGGGSLALGGGSLIEPVLGLHISLTDYIGLQTSISQVKALKSKLNTPVINLGLTINFATLNRA